MKNLNHFFRYIRFLTFFFLLSMVMSCEDDSDKIGKQKKIASIFIPLISNANNCLSKSNIEIAQGQTLGPFIDRLCFKITTYTDTTVNIITPGTTTGYLVLWSSDIIPLKRRVQYEDDPVLTITGPSIWYADVACDSCTSYTISVP